MALTCLAVLVALLPTAAGARVESGSQAGSQASVTAVSGPRLQVTRVQAARALTCRGDLSRGRAPVLFLHGTTSSSEANWSWNWNRALAARRWSFCNLDLPQSGNGDIQVSAEYVVRAIRSMHTRAGRPISLVGHSQGGMIGRWALRWWPGTRAQVGEYVGLASSNHGTDVFAAQCGVTTRCSAANWQQRTGSTFLAALNAGPDTWPGIDFTEIATTYDEVVVPFTSVFLDGPRRRLTNTTVQALCPTETVEHFGMAYDHAAWLLGLDALTHPGPARPGRVDTATCGRPAMPSVRTETLAAEVAAALLQTATSVVASEQLDREPRLRAYAR